jgi:hypothetical protein
MFACEWSDSLILREVIDGISDLVDVTSFYVNEKKLKIEASDPSVICKIEIEAKRGAFSTYETNSEVSFHLDMNLMKKICRRLRGDDKVSIRLQEGYLDFTIHNFVERYFRLPLLEFGDPLPQIYINPSVFLKMKGDVFIDLIKDIAVIGSSIIITASPENITFFSEEDGVKTSVTVSKSNDAIAEFSVNTECTSKFNLNYILSFLKTSKSVDYIDISFGEKETPLKLEHSSHDLLTRFYLAPMEI